MPTTDQNGATSSDTLQGWKDIAGYFGRSVRSVQRWEREFALPVHRIRAADGQTVYAIRGELEEWRKSRDLPKPAPEDEEPNGYATEGPDSPLTDTVAPPAVPSERLRRLATITGSALALVALGISLGVFATAKSTGPVAAVFTAGNSIVAYDPLGRVVWTHDFRQPVSATNGGLGSNGLGPSEGTAPDGSKLLVVSIRFAGPGLRPTESDALVAFDTQGNIRWKVQPENIIRCGTEVFGGPWRIYSAKTSTSTGPSRWWIAVNDPTWWPGMLIEVDAAGQSRLSMLSAGWIWDVAEWQAPTGHLLAVAGVNSEHNLPSLSLVDPDGPPVMSPYIDARFSCQSSPQNAPNHVYLLPALDTGSPDHSWAQTPTVIASGLKVQTTNNEGTSVVELGADMNVRSFSFSDSYWSVHRDRESKGLLSHSADACPERTRPQPIEEWTEATGWMHSTIVPTSRQTTIKK